MHLTPRSMTKDRRSVLQLLQAQLSGHLGPYVQALLKCSSLAESSSVAEVLKDSAGDVHLDVSFKDGKC